MKPKGRSRSNTRQRAAAGRRLWRMRMAAAILSPLLFAVFLELGLRVFGYGSPTCFLVKTPDGVYYTVNEKYLIPFYSGPAATGKMLPARIEVRKPPDTVRIFVLGESAAQGVPEPAFGFSRILEVLLRSQFPQKRFQVVNAAMRGVNSHILLPAVRDCARAEPDLFVLYLGNNEVVGLHGPGPNSSFLDRNRTLIRAVHWLKSLRIGQGFTRLRDASKAGEENRQDMEFFRGYRVALDDPRREAVYRGFRSNLEEICRVAEGCGARVVVSTVAVNLKNCPPLGSLHRSDLTAAQRAQWELLDARGAQAEADGRHDVAVEQYRAAAGLDDRFAELHFRLARCLYAQGQFGQARTHYTRACDLDALAFRADTQINRAIRDVAGRARGGSRTLVDAEQSFAESQASDHGLPGQGLFHDHVHPTFTGNYLLARTFLPAVAAAMGESLATGATPLSQDECAQALGLTPWVQLQMDAGIALTTSRPPFLDQLDHARTQARTEQGLEARRKEITAADVRHVAQTYTAALAKSPDDWYLHHLYGLFALAQQDFGTACEHLAFEVRLFPDRLTSRLLYASALVQAGLRQEAGVQFREALRIDPTNGSARQSLARLSPGSG
ncbi:MAG: tetratricopeptide repeat protein [Phycisphaerae bacterium]|nr:tetratricopeptide repeat protein [Phycisphaerae bacterium]